MEMARKRERRVGAGSDRGAGVSSGVLRDAESNQRRRIKITRIVSLVIVFPVISLILYGKIHSPSTNIGTDPDLAYAHQRGIVNAEINYRQVLDEHMKATENSSRRNFGNPVLVYVTPWNARGYEMAKKYYTKFTHISPVWYELKSQGTNMVLDGRHNVDKEWMMEVRRGRNAKVLPRIALEINPVNFLKKKQLYKAIDLIVTECKEMEFDGIVLESWSRWAAYGVLRDLNMRNMALQFVKQLGLAMHSISFEQSIIKNLLIFVIGPPHSNQLKEYDFGPEDLRTLSDAVDGFSLMTYDYSNPQNPGPNAPLKWIHSTLLLLLDVNTGEQKFARKIFLGINFYGNDFVLAGGPLGGGPIVGREYLSLLETHKPEIHWEKNSAEHYFVYSDNENVKHVVFYPSLMSIAHRLQAALSWGTGISIWEIGQGLEYFFEIL